MIIFYAKFPTMNIHLIFNHRIAIWIEVLIFQSVKSKEFTTHRDVEIFDDGDV